MDYEYQIINRKDIVKNNSKINEFEYSNQLKSPKLKTQKPV